MELNLESRLVMTDAAEDQDIARAMCDVLARRGWFVEVKASRVGPDAFSVSRIPPVGWALGCIGPRLREARK